MDPFRGGGQALGYHCLVDEPRETLPALGGGPVDSIEDLEPTTVDASIALQLGGERGESREGVGIMRKDLTNERREE